MLGENRNGKLEQYIEVILPENKVYHFINVVLLDMLDLTLYLYPSLSICFVT